MQANQLKRIHPNKKRMTVARGGKRGKTAGRGGKGQSARAGNKRRPEWRDIIKRIPKLRGRGKSPNKSFQDRPVVLNLEILEGIFSTGEEITPTILLEKGLINYVSGKIPQVKILGEGEITKAVNISGCLTSNSAKEKIEKVGGTVVVLNPAKQEKGVKEVKVSEKVEEVSLIKEAVSPKKEKNKTTKGNKVKAKSK